MLTFRSHWGFRSEYCNPARGDEKGGVESEGGWFRRNWLVPVREAANLLEFNAQLEGWCVTSQERLIHGRQTSVGEAMRQEQPHLLPLADLRFGVNEVLFPVIVDGQGCVRAKTNRYSTPLGSGIRSEIVLWPNEVYVYHGRDCVARLAQCMIFRIVGQRCL